MFLPTQLFSISPGQEKKFCNPLAQWASKFQFSLAPTQILLAQWEHNMPYQLQ